MMIGIRGTGRLVFFRWDGLNLNLEYWWIIPWYIYYSRWVVSGRDIIKNLAC
jgi:hypothetical protein